MNSQMQRGPIQLKKSSNKIVKISEKPPPNSYPKPQHQSHAPSVAPPGARQLPSHGCVFAQASGAGFHRNSTGFPRKKQNTSNYYDFCSSPSFLLKQNSQNIIEKRGTRAFERSWTIHISYLPTASLYSWMCPKQILIFRLFLSRCSRCWSSFLRLFTSALARVSSLRKRKTWAKLLGCSETLHVDGLTVRTSSSRAWFCWPWPRVWTGPTEMPRIY